MFGRWLCLLLLGCCWVVMADPLRVAAAQSLPPYVLSDTHSGAELDVVREALASQGITLEVVYVPFGRLAATLEQGVTEAAFPVQPGQGAASLYFSDVHMIYTNAVFALAERQLDIRSVADLACCSVLAFRQAPLILGDEFRHMAERNPAYSETVLQQSQIEMLVNRRVDVAVMDENIFHYYLSRYEQRQFDTRQIPPIERLYRFSPSPYRVAFVNAAQRDAFNRGLQQLRDSGRYEAILQRYFQSPQSIKAGHPD